MDLTAEVYVCCEIPWAATLTEGNYFGAEVNTHFGDSLVSANVTMATMSTGRGYGEGINPRAHQGTVELFGDETPEWMHEVGFSEVDAVPPKSSVSLTFMLPDWTNLYSLDTEGNPVKNPPVFEDLYECIMFAINQSLYSVATGTEFRVGPLSQADLVGVGVVRITPTVSKEPFYVKLPSVPPLGSYGSGQEGYQLSPGGKLELPYFGVSSAEPARRLFSWMRRSVLRARRREWAEAIVAQQAALEDWMHYLVCGIAADHGFTESEFEDAGFGDKNAAETFGILTSHLGGNSEPAFLAQKKVWRNRNAVVHRGERATELLYEESYEAAMLVQEWTRDRLMNTEVARRHPITSWVIHHEDSPLSGKICSAIGEMLNSNDITSLPMVNSRRPLEGFPTRNISRPSDCWGKGCKVPRPF
ncbi:hypothetical protein [Streptomyces coelicoflavus]|uniref:hypothetical protein n=1 Tax=Streptomyces coelicoflavus TaxID=285562 RepID=UPI00332BE4CF